jgi:predicted RNA binding protein YcfA (HicA-like mRNA interferase family)
MTALPVVTPRQLLRALERAGFFVYRTSGSHYLLRHRNDPRRKTVVPYHAADIKPGTLRGILRQTELSVDDLIKLL